ncbi:MAG: PEGA domain-containing protein [Patescibacteria group bacterium]
MDFMDPKKKRAHRKRLFVGYGLMATLIAIGTLVLVFATYGYDIDRKTGSIIQNGLVLIDASPEPAEIVLDGKPRGTTSDRLVLPAGQYSLELKRDGYRSWKHTINLEGSSIEQFIYPFLFPSKLVTKAIQTFDNTPSMASASPDRHWLVVHSSGLANSFSLIDLSNNKNLSTPISLPTGIATETEGADTYEAIEWASDNTNLLLKHTFPQGSEFIVLNRDQPAASINLNKLFASQPFTTVNLRDKKFDQYYLHNTLDGNLFTADVRNTTPLLNVRQVISYKPYQDDVIVYVTNPSNSKSSVDVHVRQNTRDSLLRTLPLASLYLLDIAQFDGRLYLAAGSPADGKTYVYKDPFSDLNRSPARTPQPFRVLIVPGAQHVSFSNNARFIAVQNGSMFAVYDAETSRQSRFDTKLPLSPGQKANWMDGHRLTLSSGGNINAFDFDGTNTQTLNAGHATSTAFFDKDYNAMFVLAPDPANPSKTAVTRTELKVTPTP